MKKVIISIILVCLASTVWADTTTLITWTLSEFDYDYTTDTQITADNAVAQLTIKGGSKFIEKDYTYGSGGTMVDTKSKGYTDNAIIHIPVFSTLDKITITCHYCCYMDVSCSDEEWDEGSSYEDKSYSKTFTPKPDDVKNGYVSITCKENTSFSLSTFFTSIAISYSDHLTSLTINDGESFQSNIDFTVDNLTFKRTFATDKGMYTLIVPFDISNPSEYGKFYEYASHTGEKVTLSEISEPKANTPYVFKPTKNFTEIKQTNTKIYATTNLTSPDSPNNVGLYGTYQKITAPTGSYGYSAGDVSGISAGTFVKTGTNVTLPPYRAYLWLGSSATAKQLSVDFPDNFEGTTGIRTIDNGQLTIDNSKVYNLNGIRVNENYKGIVIKNGKKQIVR